MRRQKRGKSVANLAYKRVSIDQQSTDRQDLVLDEAGIDDPVVFEEEPGTSSRLNSLQRPKFGELLTYARPDDTVHISEMFRLVRGTGHILDVLDVLHRDRLALRIHDGALSAMDLTARHPRTGELLSTVKFMVQTLAAAGELQRELTYDGLRAAEAKGNKGGRRPVVTAAKAAAVRAGYLAGQSIAGLARDHRVSRGAIRTAVADLMPEHTGVDQDAPAPELPVTLDMPGKVAGFLRAAEWSPPSGPRSTGASPYGAARATHYASPRRPRPTANSCAAASRSTPSRQSRPSARPAASTRTASTPSGPRPHSKPSGLQNQGVSDLEDAEGLRRSADHRRLRIEGLRPITACQNSDSNTGFLVRSYSDPKPSCSRARSGRQTTSGTQLKRRTRP
ncbi:recombinase family protein [Streptomyces sp. NBC_01508]|uniref:recombinase family protein n=1 Tax=Streptomyces sp. NBC_01508 TaxID=2903888 RepID=UPI003870D705